MISQTHKSSHKLKDYQKIFNSSAKLAPAICHVLEKLTLLMIPLPVFMLITGIGGLIEQESPENLASLGSIGSGFFSFIEMHSLIITGAFGVTFIYLFFLVVCILLELPISSNLFNTYHYSTIVVLNTPIIYNNYF
jgi:hypothetical protein